MRSIKNKLFLLLIVMGSFPLIIVLVVGSMVMKSEYEIASYHQAQLRNAVVSEHISELCEKNFYVLHTLALNPLIKHYVSNPLSVPSIQVAELLHNTNNIFNDSNIMAITGSNAIQLMRTDGANLVNVHTRRHFKFDRFTKLYKVKEFQGFKSKFNFVEVQRNLCDSRCDRQL